MTINYRLGALGFLVYGEDAIKGNFGIKVYAAYAYHMQRLLQLSRNTMALDCTLYIPVIENFSVNIEVSSYNLTSR